MLRRNIVGELASRQKCKELLALRADKMGAVRIKI
jgi:hypothetical protein